LRFDGAKVHLFSLLIQKIKFFSQFCGT
jgi:hypothetical protein